jgi:2-polyprenyl-3-methyl-5-hydroxy-6-metoxy-1,4-benzoquinol methylase
MEKTIKLTKNELWDDVWAAHALPQVFKSDSNPYYVDRLDTFFHQHMPKSGKLEFLELGCAPGRWLHYFHTEFGYHVSGFESSPVGIEITKRNLALLGVNANIYPIDVLQGVPEKKYDIVFSLGLVEHFDPPQEIIERHLALAKAGGYVVIGVPNIKKAFYGPLQWLVNKDNLKGYIHVSGEDLMGFLKSKIELVYCGYTGVQCLYLLNIPSSRKMTHKLMNTAQFFLDLLLRSFKVTGETRLFSPYIFVIGKKL